MSESIVHSDRQIMVERTLFGYRTDRPALDRIQNSISAGCGTIAVVAIVAMVFLTLFEVLVRTAFNSPLGWSVGLIEDILLPAAAFFGIVTAYRSGAHVAVVSLFDRLAMPVRKALLIVAYIVILLGLVALAWFGMTATVFSIGIGEGPMPGGSKLLIPGPVMRSIVPTAALLGIVVVTIDLVRELSGGWGVAVTDYDGLETGAKEPAQ